MLILTAKHFEFVNSATENFRQHKLLSNATDKKLIVDEVKTSLSHDLPNANKPDISGRPIVISVECHGSKISKYVDHFFQPHDNSLPSYIKDTSDFINKMNKIKNI